MKVPGPDAQTRARHDNNFNPCSLIAPMPSESQAAPLRDPRVLDALPGDAFDRVARLAQRLLEVPVVFIVFRHGNHRWIKALRGLAGEEDAAEALALCVEAPADGGEVLLRDLRAQPRFAQHPWVSGKPHARMLAAAPLYAPDGQPIGSLCVLDTRVRELRGDEQGALRDLAILAEHELVHLYLNRTVTDLELAHEDLTRAHEQLERGNEELRRLVILDPVTGIANRRYFDDYLHKEWGRAVRHESTPTALIMLDIDYFKNYNDRYGHLAGDACLKRIAHVLQEAAARRPSDLAARYGGEEFVVLLPETMLTPAIKLAESIRQNVIDLALPHAASAIAPVVTVSIGVACARPALASDPHSVVAAADRALYLAKDGGRNQVRATEECIGPQIVGRN